jgi:glucosamine kinase
MGIQRMRGKKGFLGLEGGGAAREDGAVQYVLALDGGGSATRVALANLQGEVLGCACAGPANPIDVGDAGLAAALSAARSDALEAAGLGDAPALAACLGLAGVSDPARRERVLELVAEIGLADRADTLVVPDFEIAWRGAFTGRGGIVLIAGTGSVAHGRTHDGRDARAGGQGAWEDVGSATWFGREWLQVRGVALGSRVEVAACAPQLMHAAAHGDAAALEILARGTCGLAECVAQVAGRLEWEDPPVAWVGGLTRAGAVFDEALASALARLLPRHRRLPARLAPVGGALLEALALAGVVETPALLQRLTDSLDRRANPADPIGETPA